MCKILLQNEVEWMAKKKNFDRFLEQLLLETVRRGMGKHFAGTMPCSSNDFAKLITLVQAALG